MIRLLRTEIAAKANATGIEDVSEWGGGKVGKYWAGEIIELQLTECICFEEPLEGQ